MAKTVSYANMKLKVDTSVNTFKFNDFEIEVKKYLPIEDKIDLIQVALQRAEEGGIYNDLKLEMYFNLNIVYLYTNIQFTAKQREDEAKLYDAMQSNGLITQVIAAMDEDEYVNLVDELETVKNDRMNYGTTAAALLRSVINDLPKSAEAAAAIVDGFDPEKYKAVVDFAKAANGGRELSEKVADVLPFPMNPPVEE